jgi:hypothetical protein
LDSYVLGFLLTVVVDKRVTSLFGPNKRGAKLDLANFLQSCGLGDWKPDVAEKLVRVVDIGAFLVGLLASSGQKIFWMTDDDAICANEILHRHALELFKKAVSMYAEPECTFPIIALGRGTYKIAIGSTGWGNRAVQPRRLRIPIDGVYSNSLADRVASKSCKV